MKKALILVASFMVVSVCSAQTLDNIINKYYKATGIENLDKISTIKMEGKMSQMGVEIPMSITVKKPDKVRVQISYNGLDIITMYDGVKGYMINPMMGSSDPVELPADQLGSVQNYNMFKDNVMDSFKEGKITLDGEGDVNGKPAYKLTLKDDQGGSTQVFIDKESNLIVKTVTTVNQMGQEMEVESYVKEYMDVNGIKFTKVITQTVNGMEMGGITFDKVEVDQPVDDALFTI